jgi:hypothetical protein
MKSDRSTDDIGDRVDRTDFVKVDLLDRRVVHLGFGFADQPEDSFGHRFASGAISEPLVDHRFDVVQVAVSVLGGMVDLDVNRSKSRFFDDLRKS